MSKSKKQKPNPRVSELEWLKYFYRHADFGPADSEVRARIKERFLQESQLSLPEGYEREEGTDGL